MKKNRKYNRTKTIVKLSRQEIEMIKDEWYTRFNTNYNKNTILN